MDKVDCLIEWKINRHFVILERTKKLGTSRCPGTLYFEFVLFCNLYCFHPFTQEIRMRLKLIKISKFFSRQEE